VQGLVLIDTLAIAGALASALFAVIAAAFARGRGSTAAAMSWWSAALVAESLRQILASSILISDAHVQFVVADGGNALVALLVLLGACRFAGQAFDLRKAAWGSVAIFSALIVAAFAPDTGRALAGTLNVTTAAAFTATAALFWRCRREISETRGLFVGGLSLAVVAYQIIDAGLAFAVIDAHGLFAWEWILIAHHALTLTAIVGFILVAVHRDQHARLTESARVEASEQRAAQLDRRLRDALNSLRHGIALFDAEDRLIYCNAKHKEIYPEAGDVMEVGCTFEELLRKSARFGILPHSGDALEAEIQHRLALHRNPPKQPIEQALTDRRWAQIRETRTADGCTVTSWTDITAVKRRESVLALLVEAGQSQRSALEAASEALAAGLGCRWAGVARLIENDKAEVVAMWSDGAPTNSFTYDLADTPCEALLNVGDYSLYPENVAELFPKDHLLAEMGVVSYRGKVFRDGSGALFGHIFALDDRPASDEPWEEDITLMVANWVGIALQQQRAEEELRESRALLGAVVDSVPAIINVKDRSSRYVFMNRYQAEIYGIAPEVAVGKTVTEILGPEYGDLAGQTDREVIESGTTLPYYEHEVPDRHGRKRSWITTKVPLTDECGRVCNLVTVSLDVTDRKQTEKALRRSEASLARAQQIASLGSWDWDIATDEIHWSEQEYRIFGVGPGQPMNNEEFDQLLHPDDVKHYRHALSRALRGEAFGLDYRIVRPDGQVRIVHDQGEVDFDAAGKPAFMRGTTQDVTEQRLALATLEAREHKIRTIMDNVADALVTIDAQGIIQSANPAMERLFGYKVEELIGRNVSILMADPDRSAHDSYLATYRSGRPSKIVGVGPREVTALRKDGTEIVIERSISEVSDRGGTIFVGAMRDVTQRKLAEATERKRAASIEVLKVIAAAANESIRAEDALDICLAEVCRLSGWPLGRAFLCLSDGKNTLVSACQGYSEDQERFAGFHSIEWPATLSADDTLVGRVIESHRPAATCAPSWSGAEAYTRLMEGMPEIHAAFAFPILAEAEVVGALEFFSREAAALDETTTEVIVQASSQIGRVIERIRIRQQLLGAKEAAERAARTKSEFLATMSHELRTPLNAIIGFSEIMAAEMFGPVGQPAYKDYAEDILQSGTHLLNIINDILDVSKAEAGMLTLAKDVVELRQLIQDSLRLVRSRAEDKGVEIKTDLPDAPLRIAGDRLRIKQILLNLLSNAVKFTSAGSITVKLRTSTSHGITMQVIDTGIGIPEHDLARVMEPFTQVESSLNRTHEGTGLGLPLSRVLTELHGGELSLESVFGKGTIATVRLPAERCIGAEKAA